MKEMNDAPFCSAYEQKPLLDPNREGEKVSLECGTMNFFFFLHFSALYTVVYFFLTSSPSPYLDVLKRRLLHISPLIL